MNDSLPSGIETYILPRAQSCSPIEVKRRGQTSTSLQPQPQPVRRHHALRNALAEVLIDLGIPCIKEVPIGGRRPADLGLMNFDSRGPLAVDLVCTHPGALSTGRNAEPTKPVAAAEKAKIAESEPLCHAHGWLFTPIGWHPWGGVGPHGAAFLSRVEKAVFGDLKGWPRRQAVLKFRASLVFRLMRHVTQQLRAHEDVSLDDQEVDLSADQQPFPEHGGQQPRSIPDGTSHGTLTKTWIYRPLYTCEYVHCSNRRGALSKEQMLHTLIDADAQESERIAVPGDGSGLWEQPGKTGRTGERRASNNRRDRMVRYHGRWD